MSNEPGLKSAHHLLQKNNWWQLLSISDYIFTLVIVAIAIALSVGVMSDQHDGYEKIIFIGSIVMLIGLGWFYRPLQIFIPLSACLAYLATVFYQGDFANNDAHIVLKYFLASQSAILWLCALTIMAFFCFLFGALLNIKTKQDNNILISMGIFLAWAAALMGFVGLLVRWYESYLILGDGGHIPVANLYEVFILFIVVTTLMFLYYSSKANMYKLGVFVFSLLVVLVFFVLWYSASRNAHAIQPLIPALSSWWMKIHVPANFIGYGGFSLAAMLAIAELCALRKEDKYGPAAKGFLPSSTIIEEMMYKVIAIGFLFFTIATILGALWAADAWGRYWSWDPKETWAFIVWLNYAIWLHMRLVAGWRGRPLAWWAIVGLLITAFAFLGVNMFLSGLHSYGEL